MVACHIDVAVFLGRQKPLVPFLKLVQLHFLIGKGLYDPDTGKVVLNLAVNLCNLHPVPLKRPLHPPVEIQGIHQHNGHKGKCNHGELHINIH